MIRKLLPFAIAVGALMANLALLTHLAQAAPAPAKAHAGTGAAAAPAAAPPAAAPQAPAPTPEMAQQFVKTVIAQGGSSIYLGYTDWYRTPPPGRVFRDTGYDCHNDCPFRESTTGKILSASSAAVCNTNLAVFVAGDQFNGDYGVTYRRPAQSQFTVPVDWSKVTKVQQSSSTIYLVGYRYGSDDIRIYLPTDELAQRMTRALEVLRRRCDPTTALGF